MALVFMVQLAAKKKGLLKCEKKRTRPDIVRGHHCWLSGSGIPRFYGID